MGLLAVSINSYAMDDNTTENVEYNGKNLHVIIRGMANRIKPEYVKDLKIKPYKPSDVSRQDLKGKEFYFLIKDEIGAFLREGSTYLNHSIDHTIAILRSISQLNNVNKILNQHYTIEEQYTCKISDVEMFKNKSLIFIKLKNAIFQEEINHYLNQVPKI